MPGKPRVISADLTPLIKWGLPGVFLGWGMWFVAKWIASFEAGATVEPFVAAMAVCFVALCPLVAARCLGLKRVTLTEDALHISNYRREIVVPLRDVASVNHSWIGPKSVVVRFERENEFGRHIAFLPTRTFEGLFWSSPIVDRLRDAVAAAKKSPPV